MDASGLASNLTKTSRTAKCEDVLQSSTPLSEQKRKHIKMTILDM